MKPRLQRLVISAPWGNYLKFPGATSTLGTFTLKYRGGLAYRLWRCLLTLRYHRRLGGWTNKLGLPNPGLASLGMDALGAMVSVFGFDDNEWWQLVDRLLVFPPAALEMNLSCPNVGHKPALVGPANAALMLLDAGIPVVAKLPPVRPMDFALPMYEAGVRAFHACNTLPCPGGGLSGKALKPLSLWAVEELKNRWGDEVLVIGGGGVTHPADVRDYRSAGADCVAVGSVLLNPFNWCRVPALVEAANV